MLFTRVTPPEVVPAAVDAAAAEVVGVVDVVVGAGGVVVEVGVGVGVGVVEVEVVAGGGGALEVVEVVEVEDVGTSKNTAAETGVEELVDVSQAPAGAVPSAQRNLPSLMPSHTSEVGTSTPLSSKTYTVSAETTVLVTVSRLCRRW
jgi:hypothetical protein